MTLMITPERPLQAAAEIILSSMRNVPPEMMAAIPGDGASQHDHYIYGWPKKTHDGSLRRHVLLDCARGLHRCRPSAGPGPDGGAGNIADRQD